MNKTGDMTEPRGTPALTDWGLERWTSTLMAIDLYDRKLPIQFIKGLMDTIHWDAGKMTL